MKESLDIFLRAVAADMKSQSAKVPDFRIETTNIEGKLIAPDWFKYMIYGRGPGKQPPPDRMLAWVQKNPSMLQDARNTWKYITDKGLAYLIGRKIGREGTDIWQGKRKGIDFLGAIEKNLPELKSNVGKEESLKIKTSLSRTI